MNDLTPIKLIDGETVSVRIIGQLGLYDNEGLCVIHVATGCLLAIFSDYDDAVDFATKANELINFDQYTLVIASGGIPMAKVFYESKINAVNDLRASYVTYMRDEMPGVYATRETIRTRLKGEVYLR